MCAMCVSFLSCKKKKKKKETERKWKGSLSLSFIKPSCACMLLFCLQSNTATDTVFR